MSQQLKYSLNNKNSSAFPLNSCNIKCFFFKVTYFCVCWVFVAALISLQLWQVGAALRLRIHASPCGGFSGCGAQAPQLAHRLSCSTMYVQGLPGEGLNPWHLRWQVGSLPPSHPRWKPPNCFFREKTEAFVFHLLNRAQPTRSRQSTEEPRRSSLEGGGFVNCTASVK